MKKGWLIAAVLSGAAGSVHAADVNVFGINTTTGKWAVYLRIANPNSVVAGQTVNGLSSVDINVINNGPTGPSVATSTNNLPKGTTPYTDNLFNPSNVGYGFWLVRSDGTVGPEPVGSGAPPTGRAGSFGISAGQYTFPDTVDVPYSQLVIQGAGLTAGSQGIDSKHTSATSWSAPIMIASGTYTPGSDTTKGLKIEFAQDTSVNLIRDIDPTPGVIWAREAAVGATVIDARNFTLGQNNVGDTTVRAGKGDVNLDGNVGFADLVKVAQNYGKTGKTWFDGDLDFDGVVGFSDLVQVAQSYGGPAPASPVFGASFDADMARAFSAVPEPGMLGLAGVFAIGFLAQRRKRKNA